jgi:poly-gamma-glutamate synthesis protein (capsule biosynthesis protein)
MIGTYDPALLVEGIEEAAKNSDYVVVYVHWGVERTNYPEKYQKTMAKQYIDAGADVVIGCHPHVLQGIEFYKGKPIAYSLGNFWFNNTTIESAMLKVYLDPDGTMRTQLLPVMAEGTYSYILQKETKRKSYFEFMEEISYDIAIDNDGFITEKH